MAKKEGYMFFEDRLGTFMKYLDARYQDGKVTESLSSLYKDCFRAKKPNSAFQGRLRKEGYLDDDPESPGDYLMTEKARALVPRPVPREEEETAKGQGHQTIAYELVDKGIKEVVEEQRRLAGEIGTMEDRVAHLEDAKTLLKEAREKLKG